MSPSRNSRRQRPAMPNAALLSLLLALYLQPLSSSADVVSAPTQATRPAQRPNTAASSQQQITPASRVPQDKLKPAPKAAVKPTLAATAASATPRKQPRTAKRKAADAERSMRQALEQVAEGRAAEKRAQTIRDLLARAQLDYSEGRVFEPANDNAATRYQEVLALDPSQPQALAGIQRIADVLAAEAEHVALAGDQSRTLQYILQIRALQPQHSSLQGLDARYQALLANPVALSARQQDRYGRSAQSINEAYYLLKNQPLSLSTLEQVIREYDRAAALVAQAPGLPKLKDRIILAFPATARAELTAEEPRRALSVVKLARKRGWFTQELDPLEEQAKSDIKAKSLFRSSVQQP